MENYDASKRMKQKHRKEVKADNQKFFEGQCLQINKLLIKKVSLFRIIQNKAL